MQQSNQEHRAINKNQAKEITEFLQIFESGEWFSTPIYEPIYEISAVFNTCLELFRDQKGGYVLFCSSALKEIFDQFRKIGKKIEEGMTVDADKIEHGKKKEVYFRNFLTRQLFIEDQELKQNADEANKVETISQKAANLLAEINRFSHRDNTTTKGQYQWSDYKDFDKLFLESINFLSKITDATAYFLVKMDLIDKKIENKEDVLPKTSQNKLLEEYYFERLLEIDTAGERFNKSVKTYLIKNLPIESSRKQDYPISFFNPPEPSWQPLAYLKAVAPAKKSEVLKEIKSYFDKIKETQERYINSKLMFDLIAITNEAKDKIYTKYLRSILEDFAYILEKGQFFKVDYYDNDLMPLIDLIKFLDSPTLPQLLKLSLVVESEENIQFLESLYYEDFSGHAMLISQYFSGFTYCNLLGLLQEKLELEQKVAIFKGIYADLFEITKDMKQGYRLKCVDNDLDLYSSISLGILTFANKIDLKEEAENISNLLYLDFGEEPQIYNQEDSDYKAESKSYNQKTSQENSIKHNAIEENLKLQEKKLAVLYPMQYLNGDLSENIFNEIFENNEILAKFLAECSVIYRSNLARYLTNQGVSEDRVRYLASKTVELLKIIQEKRVNNSNLILDLSCYRVLTDLIKYPYPESPPESPKDFFKWLFDYINEIYNKENKENIGNSKKLQPEKLGLDKDFFQKMEEILEETSPADNKDKDLVDAIKKFLNLYFDKNIDLRQWELIKKRPSLLKLIDGYVVNDVAKHFINIATKYRLAIK